MSNPLINTLIARRRPRRRLRRVPVRVPQEAPSTDALFIVLRRMRAPLVLLIAIFSIAVFGLTLVPGVDDAGNPHRLTAFDAFYFMSFTATTIGFGELPYPFTPAQRLWVTISIYSTVIGWAYAFGSLFSLIQEEAFRSAMAAQTMRRRVSRMREPFWLIAGYGHAGRMVGMALDATGHRFVVLDDRADRIEVVQTDALHADVPALDADARKPGVLGLAGLGNPHCLGVLALTDNDEVNLSIVMAVRLLCPELPVITRCDSRTVAARMRDFSPRGVIHPYDRYGEYLLLELRKPTTFQLVTWLTHPLGTPLPDQRAGLNDGRWIVCADDHFGREIVADLRRADLEVSEVSPDDVPEDLTGVAGLVAGSVHDSTNLAIAAHIRRIAPEVFLSVRQESHDTGPLVTAFDFDSVFIPTEIVARECLARVGHPQYWSLVQHIMHQEDAWAEQVIRRIIDVCGPELALTRRIVIGPATTPAVARRLQRGEQILLEDLLRAPDQREQALPAVPLMVIRRGEDKRSKKLFFPEVSEPVHENDQILVMASDATHQAMGAALFYDNTLQYLCTGEEVPATWAWQLITRHRRRAKAA